MMETWMMETWMMEHNNTHGHHGNSANNTHGRHEQHKGKTNASSVFLGCGTVGQDVEVEDSDIDDPDPVQAEANACVCVFGLGLLQKERNCFFYKFSVAEVYSVYKIYSSVQ